jgi:hypothetical protein
MSMMERVSTLADALEAIPEETLRQRFSPEAMEDAGIYPSGWTSNGPEELEWLLGTFRSVRDYYRDAKDRRFGMLLYLV